MFNDKKALRFFGDVCVSLEDANQTATKDKIVADVKALFDKKVVGDGPEFYVTIADIKNIIAKYA